MPSIGWHHSLVCSDKTDDRISDQNNCVRQSKKHIIIIELEYIINLHVYKVQLDFTGLGR